MNMKKLIIFLLMLLPLFAVSQITFPNNTKQQGDKWFVGAVRVDNSLQVGKNGMKQDSVKLVNGKIVFYKAGVAYYSATGTAIDTVSLSNRINAKVSFPGFGTTSSTAAVGNDSRLSDSRTPTAHNQAQSTITNLSDSLLAKLNRKDSTKYATPKYVLDHAGSTDTTSLSNRINSKISADYIIEKIGSTYYARPKGTYVAYSGSNFKTVIENAIGQLTSGGVIYISAGLYDNLAPIVISKDYITIQGAGKYLTKLKLKASADAGGSFPYTGLIQCIGYNYFTLRDIQLDGNGANQTLVDNGASGTGRLFGVRIGYNGSTTTNALIEDCYIHDFPVNGIQTYNSSNNIIRNNISKNNYWNDISVYSDANTIVEGNITGGSSDVGISVGGVDLVVRNNQIGNTTGTHGSVNSRWGIEIGLVDESPSSARINIINNTISGANIYRGIATNEDPINCMISGNTLTGMTLPNSLGISLVNGPSYWTITNNKIVGLNGQSILLYGVSYNKVSDNDISAGTGACAISVDGNSSYNIITNNRLESKYGIEVTPGSNYNFLSDNYIKSLNGGGQDVIDGGMGTGNSWVNNIGYNLYGTLNRKIQETAQNNNLLTATSDGLTTGIVVPGSQNITVTSNTNDVYIISLPAASSATIGTRITGLLVGSKICELRVQAAQATTVYINGVTTNVEAAIPAGSSFEVIQIDATHWILKAWTALGAPITAIVPDAV